MTTTRAVRDQVQNTLDYLSYAELALYTSTVSMTDSRVSWHSFTGSGLRLVQSNPSIDQYCLWTADGEYSAILLDGSLLQITYEIQDGAVAGHRLAYIPCPYDLDSELLDAGEPVADVVDLYRDADPVLRTPIRFDFDSNAASPEHPSAHLTINSPSCRIACLAPLHVRRFTGFVFQHFYPRYWVAHKPFFAAADAWHLTPPSISDQQRRSMHLAWDPHATASGNLKGSGYPGVG